ncbi:hypothetical protein TWF192_005178 [Orbilia oligospora]|uniref:Uncharacterized protein n=1 Tax=Orbilia oligospora TaxID=2813651 RepID=A0A6G1M9L6_ORBOL|nr:hypothetical protein TWF191_004525 [Orbilia oligospora]KAF3226702.1 hypothetical protein TWF191_004525 [Orbilia oligospora]KAF3250738.1 hypothetical protein TWF192_005178 [Orbilia oligospora]KAF3250739.1 hypothetical protein TWF192_005178 [Orbilia oligospora]
MHSNMCDTEINHAIQSVCTLPISGHTIARVLGSRDIGYTRIQQPVADLQAGPRQVQNLFKEAALEPFPDSSFLPSQASPHSRRSPSSLSIYIHGRSSFTFDAVIF